MKRSNRQGLILLVVLGMLALFSLLTVTYVVFASQSKSTNLAVSRRFVNETSTSTRPLFEEAIKQLIRGTTDGNSALWGHDMLGDLYGANETNLLASSGSIVVRPTRLVGGGLMTHASNNLERPLLLGSEFATPYVPGRFLRIPIAFRTTAGVVNVSSLPLYDDALTGRLITFNDNQGPLSNQTFRIHRYIGDHITNSSNPFLQASSYSILIDLAETNLAKLHNQFVSTGGGSRRSVTGTIADWALLFPPINGYDRWASGVYLCYGEVGESSNFTILSQGYEMFLNAVPINGHGISVGANGATQFHELVAPGMGMPMPDPAINYMPAGFQLNTQQATQNTAANLGGINGQSSLLNPDGTRTNVLLGDTDEPVDAADLNTLFKSYSASGVNASGNIIPSFHRAHLINYIVNWKDFNTYTELDFWATLRRIQLAVKRPLAMRVLTPNGTPAFMGTTTTPYILNASFDGPGIRPLVIDAPNNWNTYWNTTGRGLFRNWLDQLTAGPWDVDNDGDGINDSIWKNIGLPLQRTADGKLLMALVAYHVDDLDGKIDVNATGGTAQANNYVFSNGVGNGLFTRPEASPVPNGIRTTSRFAKGVVARDASGNVLGGPQANTLVSQYFQQGQGVGPAEIGFRHLLGKPGLLWVRRNNVNGSPVLIGGVPQTVAGLEGAELAYAYIMSDRYRPNPRDFSWAPGGLLGDAANRVHFMNQYLLRPDLALQGSHHHTNGLTGLPVGVRGRVAVGLDRLGNPAILNDDLIMTANNNEYEARLLTTPFQDSPFTLDEWEPIYRNHDSDMATSANRMKAAFGETPQTLPSSTLKDEITPISRSLRAPRLGARAHDYSQLPAISYFELIQNVQNFKRHPQLISYDNFRALFPLEFVRNESFNLNRPFGNSLLEAGAGYDVDEPSELALGNQRAIEATSTFTVTTHPFAVDPLGTVNNTSGLDIGSGLETRQLFARNLYCLAQLMIPDDYVFPNIDRGVWRGLCQSAYATASTAGDRARDRERMIKIRARVLAQWAANVVDFRDSDGALTRFAYDEDPFRRLNVFLNQMSYQSISNRNVVAGWTVTPGSVVWGMEQPEALLTESLAVHDTKIRRDEMAAPDRYDQFRMPQGSLFLEIYNPRSTAATNATALPAVPKGLYGTSTAGNAALNLSKLSPANAAGERFPVWRVYISGSINKFAATQTLKTPHARLTAPATPNASKFDLTFQLPVSNVLDTTGMLNWGNASDVDTQANLIRNGAGLFFDHADQAQRLGDPSPNDSRVILFTRAADLVPSAQNTPGVADPRSQVFFNRETTDVLLEGNQYLTIGPRATTYLGSRTTSTTAEAGRPGNHPSRHRIRLSNNDWIYAYDDTGANYRGPSASVRASLAMVAAAAIPASNQWSNPPAGSENTFTQIGINVSEPLPNNSYYRRPTSRVNSNNNTDDTTAPAGITPTNAQGFARTALEADAYYDYLVAGAPALTPFDDPNTTQGPLRNWDINIPADGMVDVQTGVTEPVVQQGTVTDWCTAYLQRLADPNKTFNSILNPYISVDWIPIDLTVFHGEETLTGPVNLASRQKLGACIEPESLAFNTSAGRTGQSFLSSITEDPPLATAGGTDNFLKFKLNADQGTFALSSRPSSGNNSFMTLGFLNSGYVLAAESPIATELPDLPTPYVGSPGDPQLTNRQWHPATVFWGNRPYINSFELAYVPVSSPAQLGQEFSAQTSNGTRDYYEASYVNNDPRMPKSPYSTPIQDAAAPTGVPTTDFPSLNLPGRETAAGNVTALQYPYGHLLNFFQEMPELREPHGHLSKFGPRYDAYTQQHPKDSSLAQMLDMIETQSPWSEVENLQSPILFRLHGPNNDPNVDRLVGTNNVIFAPYRAPYNNMSRRVEPGRININSIESQNVWHALLYNTLEPSDVASLGFDHNLNGIEDAGERIYPGTTTQLYNNFLALRQGYTPLAGAYFPPPASTNLDFHANIPTMFGGVFMPASEHGMVPVARINVNNGSVPAKYLPPNVPSQLPESTGSPASVTLMRRGSTAEPGLSADLPVMDKSNAYAHLYPISRLQKLVTERSNVFAVYATIGLFELDANGHIGKEYGIDSGEARRHRAFYVIDRSVPVGYRIGEDRNVEDTILVRRILSE